MMITALLDRLTGFLRAPARPDHSGDATDRVRPFPERAASVPSRSNITQPLLEALGIRHAHAQRFLQPLRIAARAHEIDASPRRVAAWLATLAHESARFSTLVENLNYSAQGLAGTWPARYADITGQPTATAVRIARRPETIANLTYANRLGNAGPESGDGWRYRGRGLIQITGRDNYARVGRALALDLLNAPDRLEDPYIAATASAWWWADAGCNALADTGDLAAVTRVVNGGLTGLDDRLRLYAAALTHLGGR